MYGPELCARFAWKNTYNLPASSRALNPAVSENADSYTWFYIFNWFNKEFVWNSAGLWSWDKDHKRDVNQTEGDFGTNDWEDDPDNTMPASKINEDAIYPQANCQPVGGDPLNQDCAYLDEDYDDWVKAHPSATATLTVHRTEPAPPTKTSTTSVSCTP
ncbi:hypothetical protein NUU61_003912 [Penicillium alfredii]|uniref:Uncharacterized protein n=1 Tax=Penicillium alfredii TaxID=1506179 RepID=A0A9W9FKB2_9EURO|nr:uncharacterized protein NUU61_003912 [Penicillium alfredii]KAJ5101690.1 hypothetical protein NUU61_003912 [Penicillium alfredii]